MCILLGLLMSTCRKKNIRITQVGVTTNFIAYFALLLLASHSETAHYFVLLYIELAISFLIGRKRTVNFRNQRP